LEKAIGGKIMKAKILKWLKAAGIRAIKTVAETAVATIGTSMMITEVNWKLVISASLLSGLLSLLISVKGLPEIKE
jgi:hypothetical protein